MSENINPYKFEDGPTDGPSSSNLVPTIDAIKDLGGIPLPKSEEMNKWGVVISVIVVIGVLIFIGSWFMGEMDFKNEQIKACNENFQNLNVKYVLKDQELQQIKSSEYIPQNNQQPQIQQNNQNDYQPQNQQPNLP